MQIIVIAKRVLSHFLENEVISNEISAGPFPFVLYVTNKSESVWN